MAVEDSQVKMRWAPKRTASSENESSTRSEIIGNTLGSDYSSEKDLTNLSVERLNEWKKMLELSKSRDNQLLKNIINKKLGYEQEFRGSRRRPNTWHTAVRAASEQSGNEENERSSRANRNWKEVLERRRELQSSSNTISEHQVDLVVSESKSPTSSFNGNYQFQYANKDLSTTEDEDSSQSNKHQLRTFTKTRSPKAKDNQQIVINILGNSTGTFQVDQPGKKPIKVTVHSSMDTIPPLKAESEESGSIKLHDTKYQKKLKSSNCCPHC